MISQEEYDAALKDGPIIVSIPGEPLKGFKDLDTAQLYVHAHQIATDTEGQPVMRIHLI